MTSLENNDYSISATHYGVAKFMYNIFKNEYKCNLVKKTKSWFQKQEDGTFKEINPILIRNRISTDLVSALINLRNKFKSDTTIGSTVSISHNHRIISRNVSLEALRSVINQLNQRKQNLINQHPQIENNQSYHVETVQDPITYSNDLDNASTLLPEQNLSAMNEIREINKKIHETEKSIDLIEKVQELQRGDIRDKIFANFADVESKLYNSSFKDGVMKELVELFYVSSE